MEQTGKIAKTHTGVRTEFARLLKAAPDADRSLLTFLAQAYKFKEVSDYGVGRGAMISEADGLDAIAGAARFIAWVTERLEG